MSKGNYVEFSTEQAAALATFLAALLDADRRYTITTVAGGWRVEVIP